MSTCKPFAKIVNRIIQEAMHGDISQYLFRVTRLSIETLRKYRQQILADNNKIADLILVAFMLGHDVIPEIIDQVDPKILDGNIYTTNLGYLPFTGNKLYCAIRACILKFKQSTTEFFMIQIFMICFPRWLTIWIETDQINILNKMYGGHRIKKWADIDDFRFLYVSSHSGIDKYHIDVLIENCIKKAIYAGEHDMLHLEGKWNSIITEYMRSAFDRHIIYTLYGGHLKLFIQWAKHIHQPISHYYELIVCGLLRCNHVDQCRSFLSTLTSNFIRSAIIPNIKLNDIMIDLSKAPIIAPLISLSTLEFCIKKFRFDVKLRPNNVPVQNFYPNILSANICAKYIIDE